MRLRLGPTCAWLAAATLLLAALAVAAAAAAAATADDSPPAYVVDTDVDLDDTAALAYLGQAARAGAIDLRAVTAEISGFAAPGAGLSHTRCLLAKLGLGAVPSSDGDLSGANAFPDAVRAAVDPIVERAVQPDEATPCPAVATEGGAARLLVRAILAARGPVTVVTSGPLTNLAEALRLQPLIALKIRRLVAMGGGIAHGGLFGEPGFDNSQEVNFWLDAPAARAVLRALSGRVSMTDLDATDDVPVTSDFRLRLASARSTTAASVAYAIASDPLLVAQEGLGTAFWWDAVNAVAAVVDGIVSYRWLPIDVVQSGPQEGRTVVAPGGALVRVGLAADPIRWNDAMIAGLTRSSRRLE